VAEFSHYFTPPAADEHETREFTLPYAGFEFAFKTDSGVFSRSKLDEGSRVLLDTLCDIDLAGSVLDLGCGWGAIGIILKKIYPNLTLTFADINPRCVELTRENLRLNKQAAEAFVSDGASSVDGAFDWIVLNPPIRAGKEKVREIIRGAARKLAAEGKLALVIRKKQGAESMMRYLAEVFASVERESRDKGYWVIVCGGRK
jgi:16S rRNA (guanine1207-N2)-methyltransferase